MLILLALGAVISWFWYFSADERVRLQVIKALERVTGGEVDLEGAALLFPEQIRIKGLQVFVPGRDHQEDNLVLGAEDVIIRYKPWSILQRQLHLREIVAYAPKLQIWYDRDKKVTNLQLLRPLREAMALSERPEIILRQGTITYFELVDGRSTSRARQSLRGRIFPDPQQPTDRYRFDLSSDGMGVLRTLEGSYDLQKKQLYTTGNFMLQLRDFTQQEQVTEWQRLYEISQPTGQVQTESWYDPNTGHNVRLVLESGALRLPVPGVELPLREVNAEILCTNRYIEIKNIDGYYQDYCRFGIKGVIEGYRRDAPYDLRIKTEGLIIPPDQWAQADEALLEADPNELPDLLKPPLQGLLGLVPPNTRRTVSKYSPTGEIDLELQIRRPWPQESIDTEYKGILTCHNAGASYADFPYLLEGISGKITFERDRVIIGPLESREGEFEARAQGLWFKKEAQESEFEITVEAEGLSLDNKLYAALRPSHQQWWRQFQPGGIVNSVYRIKRRGPKTIQEQLDVEILEVNSCYEAFPLPLSQMKGAAHWKDNQVVFDIAEARAAQGRLSIRATVTNPRTPAPAIKGKVKFDEIQLEEDFSFTLPEQTRRFFEKVTLTGRAAGQASFVGSVSKQPGEGLPVEPNDIKPTTEFDFHIAAQLEDGRLLYHDFPYELRAVAAQVELSNKELLIESLQGRHENSRISVAGVLTSAEQYRLHIEGKPLELDRQLRQAFGEKDIWLWGKLNPGGSVNIAIDLERQITDKIPAETALVSSYTATIEPLHSSFELSDFPYPFNNVTGKITAKPNLITIHQLTSVEGARRVNLTGIIKRPPTEQDYNLHLQAEAVELDEKLRQALPETPGAVWERFEPGGKLDMDLHIDSHQSGEQGGLWNLEGKIGWTDGSLGQPLGADEINVRLQGRAQYNSQAQNFDFSGQLRGDFLRIKQRPLTRPSGLIGYNGERKELVISDISSGFCQGRLAGELQAIFAEEATGYEMKLRFNDVDLAQFLKAGSTEPGENQRLKGRCDGRFYVIKPQASEERRGRFQFAVRQAVLGELPIWAQLLHVTNLTLPHEGAFNEATLTGDVAADRSIFNSIFLRGSAVALDGAGIMTGSEQQLDLVFGIESPRQLPRLPLLTSFYKAIRPGLAQVRVTGSFENPQVEPIAFPTLEEALRILIPQAPDR